MSIKGIYKFYQDGKLIGESENSLTTTGRILAIKTLMGAIPNFGSSLSVGVDGTANVVPGGTVLATNTRLGFKVSSTPVISSNLGLSNSKDALVFKGRLEDPYAYSIYEVGLFSSPLSGGATTHKSETLLSFEGSDNLSQTNNSALPTAGGSGLITTGNFRIGDTALLIKSTETVKCNNSFAGLNTFNPTDYINVAYHATTDADLEIKFYSGTATNTYTFSYTGAAAYRVVSALISSGTATSGFDWSNITEIRFSATSGDITLDGIRFESADNLDTNNGLVSRTALSTPITKSAGIPIDIEYYMRVDFNG